ncbi:glutaredoxin family protein [Paenibacillus filicis]|uniref:Glutaredoxin family protein n=1 Tax=Paenibacillus gyeongsangnamensis TaxID=3388067 RepID=A0ABT4QJS8_9BACL|nr:glutaredoxin family protein [Paenibacillus filicis]MCZ8516955.1 glutaredoxin family protein [Paenibacillus filicis]
MNIKVYWSEHCSQCKTVMDYFDEKQVPIEKINVTYDQNKFNEMLRLGGIATPLIVVGERVIHSFDRQKVDKLLEGIQVE